MKNTLTVTREDVLLAEARVRPRLAPTPARWCAPMGAWLKLENQQQTGSYKVRGALNALTMRVSAGDLRPVVAASAGNHARGVAWAARRLGLRAVVVMPVSAPRIKVQGAVALGAEVVLAGSTYEEAEAEAARLALTLGGRILPPFDDAGVIAGQGTVGLELLELAPDVVLVPIGGGGLAAGVGLALAPLGVRVVGVQVEGVDGMRRALRGEPALTSAAETIADGVRVRSPGALTRAVCAGTLDDVVTVSEAEVRAALVELAVRAGVVAEGAGAVAAAALAKVPGRRKVAVVSGGNIDAERFQDVLAGVGPARTPARAARAGELTC